MKTGAQITPLPDGRLHLHHGPIDLIIGVSGTQRNACYRAACLRFETLLEDLALELTSLRKPLTTRPFQDPVAQRMAHAITPHQSTFVTPMAAVAGAVADEILSVMVTGHVPPKAYVNNGGDIAFHLSDKHTFTALGPVGDITVTARRRGRDIDCECRRFAGASGSLTCPRLRYKSRQRFRHAVGHTRR